MLGCQQAATDHGRAAVKSGDGGDVSVMKNGNPGRLAVVSQWSEESCGQEQGGLEEMGTLDMSLFSTS